MPKAAVGFSAHTGWAAAVAVTRTTNGLAVVDRRRVELLEPGVPFEVYHAASALGLRAAEKLITRALKSAQRLATAELRALMRELRASSHQLVSCGVVLSGARPIESLEQALSSHTAKHSAEGQLYRQALLDAARACGLRIIVLPLRDLEDAASMQLRRAPHIVRQQIDELGRDLGPPWRSDHKNAALIAWLALNERSSRKRRI